MIFRILYCLGSIRCLRGNRTFMIVNPDYDYVLLLLIQVQDQPEAYLEPCQTSENEHFVKIFTANSR